MEVESTAALEAILARLKNKDQNARDELIQLTCERMRKLVGKMMNKYDRLQRWVDVEDVLQNSLIRLIRALDSVPVKSVPELFGLTALQIRRELVDLCRHYFGPEGSAAYHESVCLEESSDNDSRQTHTPTSESDDDDLQFWSDFHRHVELLPTGEKCVIELVWYHGMTQAEAAKVLNLSEAKIKRLWVAGREQIKKALGRFPE